MSVLGVSSQFFSMEVNEREIPKFKIWNRQLAFELLSEIMTVQKGLKLFGNKKFEYEFPCQRFYL